MPVSPMGRGTFSSPAALEIVGQLSAPYFQNSLEVPGVAVAHHQADRHQQTGPGRDIPRFRIEGEGGRC